MKTTTDEIQDYQDSCQELFEVVNGEIWKFLSKNYECRIMDMCSYIPGHDTVDIGWSDDHSLDEMDFRWVIKTVEKTIEKIKTDLTNIGINPGDELNLREEPSTWEDPHVFKQRKIGYYGWMEVSYDPGNMGISPSVCTKHDDSGRSSD